jgi:hypothetical protein
MKRGILVLALVFCLCLTLLRPGLVQAQGKPEILDSSAQLGFPTGLSFSLSTRSDVNITDIRLCYSVDRVSFAKVTSEVYIEFVPGTAIDVTWTLDMVRIGGLPPASNVEYWWMVTDASGDKTESPRNLVLFNDNRYQWRRLTGNNVTIYWYEGSDAFAGELMTAAHQALDRLATDTGASLQRPVSLYIYANFSDLKGAMIYPQEWTGGVAFTQFSTIVLGIGPTDLAWGTRAIAHELSHMVIHQMTLNPYGGLPVWLDEGLAVYAEGLPSPEYTSRLREAVTNNELISIRSLSSPFSAFTDQAILSYAESYSLVDYLIREYGQAKILELLNTFRQGSTYDGALERVFGFNMNRLDALWQDYVTEQYQPAEVRQEYPVPTAILIATIPSVPGY